MIERSSLVLLRFSNYFHCEVSVFTFEFIKEKKFLYQLIILSHFNLEYYLIFYIFHHPFMFEKNVYNYFIKKSGVLQPKKKKIKTKYVQKKREREKKKVYHWKGEKKQIEDWKIKEMWQVPWIYFLKKVSIFLKNLFCFFYYYSFFISHVYSLHHYL